MKNFLLIMLFSGLAIAQEKNDSVDLPNRFLIKLISEMEAENSIARDLMIHKLDSIILSSEDKTVKNLSRKKANELISLEFVDAKSIDLNTIDKKEKKGWEYEYDKFQGVTFINKKLHGPTYPYIVVKDNGIMYLRFKAIYNSDDWVFFDKIIFLINGEKSEITPNKTERDISNSSYGVSVYESSDSVVDKKIFDLLTKIANSENNVDYRFSGSKGVRDYTMTKHQKQVIKETLELYERLKLK